MVFVRRVFTGLFVLLCALGTLPATATLVSGQVTDSLTGSPLQGANISVLDVLGGFFTSTSTDFGGNYAVDVPAGFPQLSVSYGAYIPQSLYVTVDATPQTLNFVLSMGGSIAGRITVASSGDPLANVLVSVFDPQSESVVAAGSSTEDGSYLIPNIPPGQYAVCVLTPNDEYADECYDGKPIPAADGTMDFTPVTVVNDQVVPGIDIALDVGETISGTLRDSYFNTPIVNTTMYFTLYSVAQIPLFQVPVETDRNGGYSLSGLTQGNYYLEAAGFAPQPNANYTPRLFGGAECSASCSFVPSALFAVGSKGATNIDIDLFPGRIATGKITDAQTGQGIPGVTVESGELACGTIFCATGTAITDANGNYALAHISGGGVVHVATITAAGYIDQLWQNTSCASAWRCALGFDGDPINFSTPDQIVTNINFALQRGSTISGRVTLQENPAVGVPNAYVGVYYDDGQNGPQLLQVARTSADGSYTTDGWLAGTYYIAAWSDDIAGDCEFFGGMACPDQVLPYISVTGAQPIVLGSTATQNNIDVSLYIEEIFYGGFD